MKAHYIFISSVLLTVSLSSHGANSCKGQSQNLCTDSTSCSWIESFVRKDGREINAYCRSKPGKKINKTKNKLLDSSGNKLANNLKMKTEIEAAAGLGGGDSTK